MKKQILILLIAFLASVTVTWAQPYALPSVTAPATLSCALTDPLTPIAGRPYDYSAILNPAGGTTYWYATNSTTFMTGGARVATEIPADGVKILSGATNYMTPGATATSPSTTQVTWTTAGLDGINATTNPLFMVVEYTGATCANNMKVMRIVPKVAFTVDITNMVHGATPTSLAYGAAESQCYANVSSAVYNTTTNVIDIDYGVNDLYFEIVAANFTGLYKPTLKLTGLQGTQTADIDWGVAVGTYDQSLGTAVTGASWTSSQFSVSTNQTNTSAGVSIYVRVKIHNNGYEGLTAAGDAIALAVEAVDGSATANKDVDTDCTTFTDFGDVATQTLNARPAVTPGTTQVPQKP